MQANFEGLKHRPYSFTAQTQQLASILKIYIFYCSVKGFGNPKKTFGNPKGSADPRLGTTALPTG